MNVINYANGAVWNGVTGNLTTVGSAGPMSASFYGTYDQGGNVTEWTEDQILGGGMFVFAALVGGNCTYPYSPAADTFSNGLATVDAASPFIGFRVVNLELCLCGDADGNGLFTVSDAVFLINYIFAGGPAPNPLCLAMPTAMGW